jgi:hypothetical protein
MKYASDIFFFFNLFILRSWSRSFFLRLLFYFWLYRRTISFFSAYASLVPSNFIGTFKRFVASGMIGENE